MINVFKVYNKDSGVDLEQTIKDYRDNGYVHYTLDMLWEDFKATYDSEYLIKTVLVNIVWHLSIGYKILYKPEPGAVPVLYKLEE